jgi:transcriptional/translational regulatory protein YebC/TACO1
MIYAPFEQYGNLQKYLEDHDLEILSSGFERIPQNTVALTDEQREEVEKILDKLDELDDVQQVYTSME